MNATAKRQPHRTVRSSTVLGSPTVRRRVTMTLMVIVLAVTAIATPRAGAGHRLPGRGRVLAGSNPGVGGRGSSHNLAAPVIFARAGALA